MEETTANADPPPPQSAQKRSGLDLWSTVTKRPFARTASKEKT